MSIHRFLICLTLLLFPMYAGAVVHDTLTINERDDRRIIERIVNDVSERDDKLILIRSVDELSSQTHRYEVFKNDKLLWDLTLASPATELEELFVKTEHNEQLDQKAAVFDSLSGSDFRVTPWVRIPSLFKEKGFPSELADLFAWKSGGEINFSRNHLYNFYGAAGDTTDIMVDFAKPALYDLHMDLSYTHRYKNIWFGGGIERSYQKSHHFDTLVVERDGWFSRMGWNIHLAFPGFRYDMYRDPGLIPVYAQYEDSIYSKLQPDAKYEFVRELNIKEDSSFTMTPNPYIQGQKDTTYVNGKISPLGGIGHRFTLKMGYLRYSLEVHRRAYKAPVHVINMQDMPFFKGEWDIGMIVLPNGQIIPHGAFDFYRKKISVMSGVIGISPFHLELKIWDRRSFYIALGFNMEFLTQNATFSKE